MKKILQAVAFVAAMVLVVAVPATAAEIGAKPFISDEYYLPYQGSKILTLEMFKGSPRIYYRSEEAFQMSRLHAERVIGDSLTDDQFIALLQSDRVRAEACSGEVKTCGLLEDDCPWFERQCYTAEEIVEVKVGDEWRDLLSLACLNPIEDKSPRLASPAPEKEPVARAVEGSSPRKCRGKVQIQQDAGIQVYVPGRDLLTCSTILHVPAMNVSIPASNNVASKSKTPCK